MIERDLVNLTDLALFRPVRTGAGMDPTSTPTTIATGLPAIYEPAQELFTELDGRQLFVRSKFWIDPTDSAGDVIDVRANDWAQWTDFRGVLQKEQRILRVSPWFCGAVLDHLLLELA